MVGPELSLDFKAEGAIRIEFGGESIEITDFSTDPTEPYNLRNPGPTIAQARALLGAIGNSAGARFIFVPGGIAPSVAIETLDQTVNGGAVIDLAATATDEDGEIETLLWTADGGTFSDDSIEDPAWTAPTGEDVDTEYTLTLTATDDEGRQTSASITITVRASTNEAVLLDDSVVVNAAGDLFLRNISSSAPVPAEWLPDGSSDAYLVRVRVFSTGKFRDSLRSNGDGFGSGSGAGSDCLYSFRTALSAYGGERYSQSLGA